MTKAILVVDDELLIAFDVQSQVEERGYRAVTASTVSEAVALLERTAFDVAVVDWHMRGENSASLLGALQERQIPFVLCSGLASGELSATFPGVPVVAKPFARDQLIEVVTKLVEAD